MPPKKAFICCCTNFRALSLDGNARHEGEKQQTCRPSVFAILVISGLTISLLLLTISLLKSSVLFSRPKTAGNEENVLLDATENPRTSV